MSQEIVTIESIDHAGNGITRIDGKTVFVAGALPDEKLAIDIYKKKSRFDLANIVEIITPSPYRVTPKCPNFGVCGGCSLQHMEIKAQVKSKEKVLLDNFKHIAKIDAFPEVLQPLYGEPWSYRYRARLSARYVEKKGGVLVGFREKGNSFVCDMNECLVLPQFISNLIPKLRVLINQLSIRDRIPQIEVAVGEEVSILGLRIMESLNNEDEYLLRQFIDDNQPSLDTELQIWLQPKGPNSMYPFYPVARKELYYQLPEFNITIPFAPTEFTQVNHKLNQEMVSLAINLLDLKSTDNVLDLFCGIGNFTLAIATKANMVLGVEGSEALVKRAKQNALRNNLEDKVDFKCMNLFNINSHDLNGLISSCNDDDKDLNPEVPNNKTATKRTYKFNKWLIDPPRDGATDLVQAITVDNMPDKIVYVSCKPATLARDAGFLVNNLGYKLTKTGVMNMFPHTSHVESIAVFDK